MYKHIKKVSFAEWNMELNCLMLNIHTHRMLQIFKFCDFSVDLTSTLGLELIIVSNGLLTPHSNKLAKVETSANWQYWDQLVPTRNWQNWKHPQTNFLDIYIYNFHRLLTPDFWHTSPLKYDMSCIYPKLWIGYNFSKLHIPDMHTMWVYWFSKNKLT